MKTLIFKPGRLPEENDRLSRLLGTLQSGNVLLLRSDSDLEPVVITCMHFCLDRSAYAVAIRHMYTRRYVGAVEIEKFIKDASQPETSTERLVELWGYPLSLPPSENVP